MEIKATLESSSQRTKTELVEMDEIAKEFRGVDVWG